MRNIKIEDIKESCFQLIGDDWMLISAGDRKNANAMTASWGGMGVLWGKKVAFVFIRPQRFTKKFVDKNDYLTLSFFGEEKRQMLNYMGSVSGKDENKILNSGLEVNFDEDAPIFADAKLTLLCRKMYVQNLEKECFMKTTTVMRWYPKKDFHTMYVVEICKAFDNDKAKEDIAKSNDTKASVKGKTVKDK